MNHARTEAQGQVSRVLLRFPDAEKRHRLWIALGIIAGVVLAVAVGAYGLDYYLLDQAHRPLSPKHVDLRPSGSIGLRLGMLGFALFALIFLYPLRKRWTTLSRIGKTQHWLNYHVLMGLIAPVVITYHCAFKVHGFAGMAYWCMAALTASGLVGRYAYAQIPRSLNAAEMSLTEIEEKRAELAVALKSQNMLAESDLDRLLRLPDREKVKSMWMPWALVVMIWLDLARPFHVWALRRRAQTSRQRFLTIGGILQARQEGLERIISMASKQASLSKRILFLSKTHSFFHLWHVIHRPLSLSFAIFVILHVAVVTWLGFY